MDRGAWWATVHVVAQSWIRFISYSGGSIYPTRKTDIPAYEAREITCCVFAFLAIPCPSPPVDFLASLWDSDEGQMRERGTLVHSHPVGIPLESPCFPWNLFRVEKKVHTNRIDRVSSWRRLLRVPWTMRRLNQSIL